MYTRIWQPKRLVATLGRLDQLGPTHLDPLIQGLNRALGRAESTAAPVTYESARAYGDVYALHALWTELGFADAVRAALRSSRRSFDAEALVRAMVFNHLCAPTATSPSATTPTAASAGPPRSNSSCSMR